MRNLWGKFVRWHKTRHICLVYCPRFGYGIYNTKERLYRFYNSVDRTWDAYPLAKRGDVILDTGGIEFLRGEG